MGEILHLPICFPARRIAGVQTPPRACTHACWTRRGRSTTWWNVHSRSTWIWCRSLAMPLEARFPAPRPWACAHRVLRLAAADTPAHLLVGNHGLPNAARRANMSDVSATHEAKQVMGCELGAEAD